MIHLFLLRLSYRVLVFVITYLLPTVCMAYWNFRIAVVLTTSTVLVNGDNEMRNNLQLSVLVKKRKVIKLFNVTQDDIKLKRANFVN